MQIIRVLLSVITCAKMRVLKWNQWKLREQVLHRIQLLTNLSIFVWASILGTVSRGIRNNLLRLTGHIIPGIRTETGLLVNTYELMRERLRDSLQEIEQKNKQLEESEEQLRVSRDFLQTIMDSLDDELMVLDNQLRIIQANRKLRLAYKGEEALGHYCYEVTHGLNHPCRSPSCVCPVNKIRQTGMSIRVTHTHAPDTGNATKQKYVEISASPLRDSNGKITHIVEMTRDITENKELENQILEANKQLLALNAIATTASQSLSLGVILNSALDKVLEMTDGESGGIFLLNENSGRLSLKVYRGLSAHFIQGAAGTALGEGIAGEIAQQVTPLVIDDLLNDSRVSRWGIIVEEGIRALVGVSLTSKEKVVGVLMIANHTVWTSSKQKIQFLSALGHQLGIAIENARLYQELQQKEEIRSELLRQIISAHEDERRRVARELHDVTSQALATLAIRLEAFTAMQGHASKGTEIQAEEIRSLLASTSKEVHGLIYDLRPSLLDDLGLPAALRSCAHNTLEPAGVEVHIEVAGQEKRLPPQIEIALFRIVQEAISNIARHAKAESTYINLEFKERSILVQVEDDGTGFDLTAISASSSSKEKFGLLGMKERAELLGGTLNIETKPGHGTRVVIEIPISWEQDNVKN